MSSGKKSSEETLMFHPFLAETKAKLLLAPRELDAFNLSHSNKWGNVLYPRCGETSWCGLQTDGVKVFHGWREGSCKWLTETGTVNGSAQQGLQLFPCCVWSSVRTLSKACQSPESLWLCLKSDLTCIIYLICQRYCSYAFSSRNNWYD